MDRLISAMHYPHWIMIGGGVLVVVGFIGFAFQKNAGSGDAATIVGDGSASDETEKAEAAQRHRFED